MSIMVLTVIYFSGVLIALLLISILAHYMKKNGDDIDDYPLAMCLSILSWLTIILFLVAYKQKYKTIFENTFKKDID